MKDLQDPLSTEVFKYFKGAVRRSVVDRYDAVNASIQMKIDVFAHDISFVAHQERHDQFHVALIPSSRILVELKALLIDSVEDDIWLC